MLEITFSQISIMPRMQCYSQRAQRINSDVLNFYEFAASTMGLHTNCLKTKIQNIGAGPAFKPAVMDNQTVESVMKFTYLGSKGYSAHPEICRRLGMANSIIGQLDRIRKQQRLSMQTKFWLYSSLTVSMLLYGPETWTLYRTDSDKLQAFHMMPQRRILGIKWYDFVSRKQV